MKAQITIDFMLAVGVALIFFIILLNIIHAQEQERDEIVEKMYARNVIEDLASTINSVYLAGEGSNRTVILPATLEGGASYTLRAYPKSVLIAYKNGEKIQSTGILPANVGDGDYIEVTPGKIRITYSGGRINIENE
jgi:hypothetical protein